MPTFIALIDFTEQGVHAIEESPKRAEAVVKRAEKSGLTVKDIYWTTGVHDGVLIVDAPDDKAAAAFFLSLVKLGNVRTTTLRAFDRFEFEQIVAQMRQMAGHAVFFISTGRCGTQWFARMLRDTYADLAHVEHEPIGPAYRPRLFLRQYDQLERLLEFPRVAQHVRRVEQLAAKRVYVETGWPCYAAIPLFIDRLPDVRLVHVVRNPVRVALSLVRHGFHQPQRRNDFFTKWAQLDPSCAGIVQDEYRERWAELTPYERCLFTWTEINLFAEELHTRHPDVPFHRVRIEDVWSGDDSLGDLMAVLGLPEREGVVASREERVDQWQLPSGEQEDWRLVFEHPRTVDLARSFGYELENADAA